MDCDICGASEAWRKCKTEGTILTTCDTCISLGEEVKEEQPLSQSSSVQILDIHPNYASRIKIARESRRLSITDLSNILGESEKVMKKIENGELRPPITLANKMEDELGIEILCKFDRVPIKQQEMQKVTVGDVATVI